MILAAGLGTRLRPLTELRAKPMVPIGDRPAIAHVLDRLHGRRPVVVNVHHRPGDLEAWAPVRTRAVLLSREPILLGTAGGVGAAADLLGPGDVLLWNADILCELDPSILTGNAFGVLAVARREQGNVGLTHDGRVVRLRHESIAREDLAADFLGIHALSAAARLCLPAHGCLVGDVYIPAMKAGERLLGVVTDAPFVDVGSIESYREANRRWLGTRPSWAHPSARVRAGIEGSVISAGAQIDAECTECVVWPGAHVTKPIRGQVIVR